MPIHKASRTRQDDYLASAYDMLSLNGADWEATVERKEALLDWRQALSARRSDTLRRRVQTAVIALQ